MAAVEERIECDLELGDARGVVPELEVLAREHPLREQLWAKLMLALYRTGRQADALRAFASARRALVDTLGVEPGAELRDLERRILQQDASLFGPSGSRGADDRPPPETRRRAGGVLLVDDHPMWRETVEGILERAGHRVVGVAGSISEAVKAAGMSPPDVVVMDVDLPDGNGADAVRAILRAAPNASVLMLTASSAPDHVLRAVEAGAIGYLLKDATGAALVEAVDRALSGEPVLTGPLASVVLRELRSRGPAGDRLDARDRRVLRLLSEGRSTTDIARDVGVPEPELMAMLTAIVDRLQGR
jgi:DNA-binding NarL/FixJ family response regulator